MSDDFFHQLVSGAFLRSAGGSVKLKVKERIVLREIHLRTTGRHLSIGSHSITCHPTFIDPVRMKG